MSFHNIPNELKQLKQWVCWRYEMTDTGKQTKLPYDPRTGKLASVTDHTTWCTFDEAVNSTWNGYDGIGFVFTAYDEYCGIDLDHSENAEERARQELIYQRFNSYSEYSPSGQGLHIIVRARLPHGRKRAAIEMYSAERYFTFTGNVLNPAPIQERQELAQLLWEEMGPTASPDYYAGDVTPKAFDEEVYNAACRAQNGDKFSQLWNGNWQFDYPSQSEADQALMNIIVFHTKNRAQAARLFRMSALGQREKAKRTKFIEYTIDKAFDLTLPPVDLSALVDNMNATIAANKQAALVTSEPARSNPPATGGQARTFDNIDIDLWRNVDPPGVLKTMLDYFMVKSPRPVRSISLAAALSLMAGIAGRAYNVSGTGLNQYIMILAETGRGKESVASNINKLMGAIAGTDFEAAWSFLGPSDMASGAGLLKHLAEHETPSFVSITGEIGLRLQQMAHPNANMADKSLQRVLLDLYSKSGAGDVMRPTVYSDKKNNVPNIHSPAFTWLGESTPSEFYKALNESQISSGLLPRFLIIEFDGDRPPLNERHESAYPPAQLLTWMRDIIDTALKANQAGTPVFVGMTADAREQSRMLDLYCDHKINSLAKGNPLVQLWNRVHLKVLRLAAVLSVAHNHHSPIIDKPMLEWALSLIMTDVLTISARFESGEVGQSQIGEAFGILSRGMVELMEGRKKLSPTDALLAQSAIVSRSAMMAMTAPYSVYKQDKRLFGEVLAELEKQGVIVKLSKMDAATTYNSRAELYQVSLPQWFYDNRPM